MTHQKMAQQVLAARAKGDPRFVMFTILVAQRTGLVPGQVIALTEQMAVGDFSAFEEVK